MNKAKIVKAFQMVHIYSDYGITICDNLRVKTKNTLIIFNNMCNWHKYNHATIYIESSIKLTVPCLENKTYALISASEYAHIELNGYKSKKVCSEDKGCYTKHGITLSIKTPLSIPTATAVTHSKIIAWMLSRPYAESSRTTLSSLVRMLSEI
jgi:hypothetical protein